MTDGRRTIHSEVQTIHRMNCKSEEANYIALQSFVFQQYNVINNY